MATNSTSVPSLANKIIDYREFIARSTQEFVGRQWVRDAVDEFLKAGGPRYFLLLGEPGSGKSAFMAQLVRERRYPHHFIGRGSQIGGGSSLDWRNPVRFAESIGYQLLRDYGGWIMNWEAWGIEVDQRVKQLDGQLIGAQVGSFKAAPRPADQPILDVSQEVQQFGAAAHVIGVYIDKFVMDVEQIVQQLLTTPLQAIAQQWPEQPVVIVTDGLDEAQDYSNPQQTILKLLPDGDLPTNVRFLLSSRPGEHLTSSLTNQARTLYLSDDKLGNRDPHAIEDARAFVVKLAGEDPVRAMLGRHNLKPETLGEQIATASQGNFLYLRHYAQGLRDGDERLLDLGALPRGLPGIYADFLGKIKEASADLSWDAAYKPILGLLAVAQEPLTRRQIADFTSVKDGTVATILMRLKQFLDASMVGNVHYYAVYHKSFGEYLVSEENEDYIDWREAHGWIVEYYGRRCSAEWSKITEADDYGLLHLATHLHALRDDESQRQALYHLCSRPVRDAKLKRLGSERSFLSDLALMVSAAKLEEAARGVVNIARAGFIAALLGELLGDSYEVYRAVLLLGGEQSFDSDAISDPRTAAHVLFEQAERLAAQKDQVDREVLQLLEEALKRAGTADDKGLRRQIACVQARADLSLAIATVQPDGHGDPFDLAEVLRVGAHDHADEVLRIVRQQESLNDDDVPGIYAAVITKAIERGDSPEQVEAIVQEGLAQAKIVSRPYFKVNGLAEIAVAVYSQSNARALALLQQAEELCTGLDHDDHGLRFLVLHWGCIDWTQGQRLAGLIEDPAIATQAWAELARLMRSTDPGHASAAYQEAQQRALQIDPTQQDTQRKNWIRDLAMETAELESRHTEIVELGVEDMWGEGRRHGDLTVMLKDFASTLARALPADDESAYQCAWTVLDRIPDQHRQERARVMGSLVALLAGTRSGLAIDLLAETLRRRTMELREIVRQKIDQAKRMAADPNPWDGWPGYWKQKLESPGDDAWRWLDAVTLQAQVRAAENSEEMESLLAQLQKTSSLPGAARQAACQIVGRAYGYEFDEVDMPGPGLISDAEVLSCLGTGIVAHLLDSDPERAAAMAQELPAGTSGRVDALARVAAHYFIKNSTQARQRLAQAEAEPRLVEGLGLDQRAINCLARQWATVDPKVAWQLAGLRPGEWEPDITEDDYPFSSRMTVEKIVAEMAAQNLDEALQLAATYPQFRERYMAVIACRINERTPDRVADVIARMTDPSLLGQLAARFMITNPSALLEAWGRVYAFKLDAYFEMMNNFIAFLPDKQASIRNALLSTLEEDQAFLFDVEQPRIDRLKSTAAARRSAPVN